MTTDNTTPHTASPAGSSQETALGAALAKALAQKGIPVVKKPAATTEPTPAPVAVAKPVPAPVVAPAPAPAPLPVLAEVKDFLKQTPRRAADLSNAYYDPTQGRVIYSTNAPGTLVSELSKLPGVAEKMAEARKTTGKNNGWKKKGKHSKKGAPKAVEDKKVEKGDMNAGITVGMVVTDLTIADIKDRALRVSYQHDDKRRSAVLDVSQLGFKKRDDRDKAFAAIKDGNKKGDKIPEAIVTDVSPPTEERPFTYVRVSVLALMLKREEEAEAAAAKAHTDWIKSQDGKIVTAGFHQLATKKDETGKAGEPYGVFMNAKVDGKKLSGLLHTSEMHGSKAEITSALNELSNRVAPTWMHVEVAVKVTERAGKVVVAFSERGVKSAKDRQAAAGRKATEAVRQEATRANIRQALASGTEAAPVLTKVIENHLGRSEDEHLICQDLNGLRYRVNAADLRMSSNLLTGTGRDLKIVPTGEAGADGFIPARRHEKKKS